MAKTVKCSVKDCGREIIAKGLCAAHYQRLKNHGDIDAKRPINARHGSFNRNWKGGEINWTDGRVLIYAPDHPNANISGGTYIFRYRLVMEEHLGRLLRDDEIIHHKNGDVTDDRIENLEVMGQSNHAKIHDSLQTSDSVIQSSRTKGRKRKRNDNGTFSA